MLTCHIEDCHEMMSKQKNTNQEYKTYMTYYIYPYKTVLKLSCSDGETELYQPRIQDIHEILYLSLHDTSKDVMY